MKRKKLLFSLVGAMFGILNAGAATWESPTMKFTNFVAGDTLYLNNVETSKFLSTNGSTPSIATNGMAIIPILNGDGSYNFKCSSNGTDFTYMYIPDANSLSTAGTEASEHKTFTVDDNGDGSFKFRPNKDDLDYGEAIYIDVFCGVSDYTAGNTLIPLVFIDPADKNAVNWKVLSKADYIDFTAKNNLSEAMTKAQSYELDITSALDVYNNPTSTNEQYIAATSELNGIIEAYEIEHASDLNPVDFSSKIVNATCGDLAGWTLDPSDAFNNDNSKGYNWCGGGSDGAVETWISGGGKLSDRSMTQSFSNLPNGKYIIGGYICAAQQGNDPQLEDGQYGVYLYASASGLEARTNASTIGYNAKYYEATAYVSDGTLTLGAVVENCNCNWICLDNFSLKYCGKDGMVDGIKALIQPSVDSAAVVLENGEMNQTYIDDLTSKKSEASDLIANAGATFEDCISVYNALNTSITAAVENQLAYVELKEAFDNAVELLNHMTTETTQVSNLSDFVGGNDIDEIMMTKRMVNAEITECLATLSKLSSAARNSQIQEGADVTFLVQDAGFDDDHSVWGTSLPDFEKSLAVKWCSGFDMNQTFSDLPAGTYKLQVQAFDRAVDWSGTIDTEFDAWVADPETRANAVGLTIYMNSDEKKVKHMFAEGDHGMTEGYLTSAGWYAPSQSPWDNGGTTTVRSFFDAGLFENELTTVVTDGTLKIGIKSGFLTWGACDNVRLTYVGPNREDGIALLQAKLDIANKALVSKMNGDLRKQLQALADSSSETLEDEASTFSRMTYLADTIANLMPSVNNSISNYKNLFKVDSIVGTEVIKPAIVATETGASLKIHFDETSAVYAMDYPTYVDAEIDSLVKLMGQELLDAQAKVYITTPGDVTAALLNPSFDFGNSFGWTISAYNAVDFHEAEVYNRTFDAYQILHGVPNGKYILKAQAFFRPQSISTAVNNYNSVDGATPDEVKSFLYANDDSVAIKHIASEPSSEKLFDNGTWQTDFGYVVGSDSAYVPASMHGASFYIASGKYENEVTTIVTDNTLRIGIKMPDATGNSDYWTLFDNFRLTLLDPTDVENTLDNTVKTESFKVFDVNGIQKSKLSKGLNIVKKTMSDGTTVVEKTMIK